VTVHPYRLGFAVKVLGRGGLKTSDTRRWQSGPHLRRSLELLGPVLEYLDANDLRMFRLSSSTVPYGTHPDLPELDYRRQIESCAADLEALGARARELGIRLSTHPGQYTVVNAPDPELARKARLDLEQDALLLDALGAGPEATVVVHVGGAYGDRASALDRWAGAYGRLSERARRRVAVEHDERLFSLDDVLELHRRTGVRTVFDLHHHRLNGNGMETAAAFAAAYGTWPAGVRPKAHVSTPRSELRVVRRGGRDVLVPPRLEQHADFVSPWDAAELVRAAPGPFDLMLEAKAKDVALVALRAQLGRLAPEVSAGEERTFSGRRATVGPVDEGSDRRPRSPARRARTHGERVP
jgi:UV DNA damage endonuclease